MSSNAQYAPLSTVSPHQVNAASRREMSDRGSDASRTSQELEAYPIDSSGGSPPPRPPGRNMFGTPNSSRKQMQISPKRQFVGVGKVGRAVGRSSRGSQSDSDDDDRGEAGTMMYKSKLSAAKHVEVEVPRISPRHEVKGLCDFFWNNYTFFVLVITAMCLHSDQNLAAPNLTAIARDFGMDDDERDRYLGAVTQFGFFIIGGGAALTLGPLADTYPRVRLMAIVVIMGNLPLTFTPMIPHGNAGFHYFFITRVLTGISIGGSMPLVYSLCGDLFPPQLRSLSASCIGVSIAGGTAIGQLLAGFIGPVYGWRWTFFFVSIPSLCMAILLVCTCEEPKRDSGIIGPLETDVAMQPTGDDSQGHDMSPHRLEQGIGPKSISTASSHHIPITKPTAVRQMFREVFEIETNKWLFIQAFPGCIGWSVVAVFLNDFLHQEGGLSIQGATKLTLAFGVSALVFALLGGGIGQWMYNKNPWHLTIFISAATLLSIPSFVLLFHTEKPNLGEGHHPSLWAIMLVMTAGVAAVSPPHIKGILQNANPSSRRGTVFSCLTLFDDLGKGLGPTFVWIMIRLFGRRFAFSAAFCLWGICSFCTFKLKDCICADVLAAAGHSKLAKHVRSTSAPLE